MKVLIIRHVFNDADWAQYRAFFSEKDIRDILRCSTIDELDHYTNSAIIEAKSI